MISELTKSVCSLIEEYQQEAADGLIPEDSARTMAVERVRQIRYGDELKDYFWIIDNQPRMIMHPYRTELLGADLNNYKDPEGKLLFVEALKTVAENGEGFIDYMWQWKDDSTRIVPKLSFVQAFPQWEWVIGTGIYLEDVRLEIAVLTRRLLRVALLITLIISTIIIFIIRQSLGIENRRKRAVKELRLSREKYKSLVEASTEGTLMMVDDSFIFSNIKFSDLSGYDPSEVRHLATGTLFNLEWASLVSGFSDPKKSVSQETTLKCKDGSVKDVVISVSLITYAEQTGYILIVKEVSKQVRYEKEKDFLSGELQVALSMMNQPLHSLAGEISRCPSHTTIREAVLMMARKQINILFIHQGDKIVGVVNGNDLTERVLATDKPDPGKKVIEIMTSPVVTISGDALLSEGLLLMKKKGISHIALTGKKGNIVGAVGYEDIGRTHHNTIGFLVAEIKMGNDISHITNIYKRLPVLIKALIESGSNTVNMTRIISMVADAVHCRLIDLAMEEFGPAPCSFAFMVMGSQGREEQTLATDQDNAIVFEDNPEGHQQDTRDYFLKLGKRINEDLHSVGYAKCQGEFMAGNPEWNQVLHTWKEYFTRWIGDSDPKDILDVAIFFDFRCVYGNETLVSELRDHVNQASDQKSVFFYHMAQSVSKMKPPLNLFGNIRSDAHSDDLSVDIKKVLLPVTSFVRLYAIREKLSVTGTLDRTYQLFESKVLGKSSYEEIIQAFKYLTYLRIRNQASTISANEIPGNSVSLHQLSRMEVVMLKKLFSDIAGLHTRLGAAFSMAD